MKLYFYYIAGCQIYPCSGDSDLVDKFSKESYNYLGGPFCNSFNSKIKMYEHIVCYHMSYGYKSYEFLHNNRRRMEYLIKHAKWMNRR